MINSDNTRGIVFMLLAMAGFALADTLVKVSSSVMTPAQVLFILLGGGLVIFALMAIVQKQPLLNRGAFAPLMLVRYMSEIAGMVGMVLALAYVPLSTVGAVTQATPILVAVGSVLFLGEKVSWRRWSCIGVGFLGVLLIVQPGTEGFDLSVLWALLAMVSLSVRDLMTRLIPTEIASSSLATYTMIASVPVAAAWVLLSGDSLIPDQLNWWIILPMVSMGSCGYVLLIASLRMSDVSVVTPFRYSRIIFLLILGVAVFDERPSQMMLIGAALIIASGLYMMWREQQVKRSAREAGP
ncbi:MAG: DMT family transporter [Rhizobiaceae bacterium]